MTTRSRHPIPIAPNVLARQFERATSAFWAFRACGGVRRGGRTLFLTLGALGVIVTWTAILVDPVAYIWPTR